MRWSENGFFVAQGQSILNDTSNITAEQVAAAWETIQANCVNDADEIGRMVGVLND